MVIAGLYYRGEIYYDNHGDWLKVEGIGTFRFYRFKLATSEEEKIYENELEMSNDTI